MDWGRLFLSCEGRIRQQDYWIGVLILIGLWIVSHLAHIFAPLLWLILIYPWICVITKRLHDFGRSGWLILIPIVIGFLCVCAAFVVGGAAIIGAIFAASTDNGADLGSWAGVLGAFGLVLVFLAIAAVVKLIFLLWVGLHGGEPGPNHYGPPPGEAAAPPPAPTV